MIDLAVDVPAALEKHPEVHDVRLAGSRGRGHAHDRSDWDFLVVTDSFGVVERDLGELVTPLGPLSGLWDPYSDVACYMLMLHGPTKVDLIFPAEKREWAGPWEPTPATLGDIDRHFWDWILWLEQKPPRWPHGATREEPQRPVPAPAAPGRCPRRAELGPRRGGRVSGSALEARKVVRRASRPDARA